jgi:uncharacterized protein
MSEERQIDYDALLHEAFREAQRGVMRGILTRVAEQGLPGEHHFYISFHTLAPGVAIAPRLLNKYPTEMTIVLQHRFWDLFVQADRFEVKLTFDSIRERLVIPFSAVRMFFDPSVPYGLQFDEPGADRGGGEVMGFAPTRNGTKGSKAAAERKKTRKTRIESVTEGDDLSLVGDDDAAKPAFKTASSKSDDAKSGPDKSGLGKPSDAAASAGAIPGPTPKNGPRLVDTSANDSAKVVSLDQFRKK